MGMFDLIKLLTDAGIDFVLAGGLAVALQGYQRVPMDIDVVLAMEKGNLKRLVAAAKVAGLRPVAPVDTKALTQPGLLEQWHNEEGMPAFSLHSPDQVATVMDILIKPVVPYGDLRRAASLVGLGPLRVPVASIDHLMAMKTGTGRGKDLIDIEELRKIQAGTQA